MLKGIQDPEDALKAVEHGMDGVFVSNHGGRQVDGAVGSLEMLPEVVEAVKGKKGGLGEDFVVMFDSGIRTGADIVKAICLGAKMVGVGRRKSRICRVGCDGTDYCTSLGLWTRHQRQDWCSRCFTRYPCRL